MHQDFRYKQVLVARLDLGMGRGKIAVQCSHAAVSAAEEARARYRDWWKEWMEEGQCKVALKVRSMNALLELEHDAKANGLPVYLVRDRGLTQLAPGTVTCLGIGPAPASSLDPLTGKLALL